MHRSRSNKSKPGTEFSNLKVFVISRKNLTWRSKEYYIIIESNQSKECKGQTRRASSKGYYYFDLKESMIYIELLAFIIF